jgi:general secretion pathway protein E
MLCAEQHADPGWLNATRLTSKDFADELAEFYACKRVQRSELVADRFAGADLSPRFLQEGHFFPYRDETDRLMLAIAAPVDRELIRAVEVALGKSVALAVATSEDLEAALSITQNGVAAGALEPVEAVAAGSDNLDDLRDLARGAPIVRAHRWSFESCAGAPDEHGKRLALSSQNHGGLEHHRAASASRWSNKYYGCGF